MLLSFFAKEEGNQLFSSGHFEESLQAYTRAIKSLNPHFDPVLHLNRSAALTKLKRYDEAITVASIVTEREDTDEVRTSCLKRA